MDEKIIREYKKKGYRNFHLHTDASHLDGMNDIPSLIKRLKEIKHDACAVTDHGNMHNIYRFYKKAIENGIKPLLGNEFYMSQARQLNKKTDFMMVSELMNDPFIYEGDKSHLIVLAKDFKGYQNLCRLTTESASFVYNKPRIDYELLKKYSEGLIVIEGHVGTTIARLIERACKPVGETKELQEVYSALQLARAYEINQWYIDVFGDDYYLEIQNHWLDIEKSIAPHVIKMAQETGVKLVASNDSHYTWKSDADIHRAHMANGLSKSYEEFMDADFEGFTTCDEFYIKDNDEMLTALSDYGDVGIQALLNTHELVEKCNVEIPFVSYEDGKWKTKEHLFPNFEIPAPYANAQKYFEYLAREGLKDRIAKGEVDLEQFTEHDYWKRLEYEIGVIDNMGFPTYFLVLWDIVDFCIRKGIPVGKGRGSGAGSLVCYSLRITDVDSLKYDLLFERFLNPARISLPDIDTDFCMDRVIEVFDYIIEKYGADHFCKIGTFGTLSAKAVIKDMARVLKYDFQKTNSMTKKVTDLGITIDKILEKYEEIRNEYENDELFHKVVDYSRRLEGMQRHTSQHAAGILISPFPLTDAIPLKGQGIDVSSQFDMHEVEEIGFVKLDALKLRTLTIIKNTTNAIAEHLGEHIDINKINFEDDKVFEKFREGETVGIFQFESEGMRGLLKRQQPTKLLDLSAVNALYRPGPLEAIDPEHNMSMANVYVERAGGRMEVKYAHPLLEEVQKDSYGVFVYQETVMRSAVVLAGYSLSESDDLRKAIGKKIKEKIDAHRGKFVKGCENNPEFVEGCGDRNPTEVATEIYDQIETFARYGFNKSHSLAYAILAYQSMWLKTYYPEFFMASVLTSYIGKKIEEMIPYLNEARRLDIKLLAPDVNRSSLKFEVSADRKGIHFGLNGIKGVGQKAVENILEVRMKQGFQTISDFIMMTGSAVNKTVVLALAEAGAFDFLGYNRRTIVKVAEDLIAISANVKKKIAGNKKRKNPVQDISSFYQPFYDYEIMALEEFPNEELCRMEKELTGFYMTHHPLEGLIDYIQSKTTHSADIINNGIPLHFLSDFGEEAYDEEDTEIEYEKLPQGQFVITGGVIKQVKEITIKRGRNEGKKMASIVIEDAYQGDVRCTVFNQQYEKLINIVKEGKVVFIKGNIDYFNENAQVNVVELTEVNRSSAKTLARNEMMEQLLEIRTTIKQIEETIDLLGDDANLIADITDELISLYDKQDKISDEIERLELGL
jgi:DNA polymerase-3 subunit alpha